MKRRGWLVSCVEAWQSKMRATLVPLARPFTIPLYGKGSGQRENSLALPPIKVMSSDLRDLVAVQEQTLAAVANLSESSEGIFVIKYSLLSLIVHWLREWTSIYYV